MLRRKTNSQQNYYPTKQEEQEESHFGENNIPTHSTPTPIIPTQQHQQQQQSLHQLQSATHLSRFGGEQQQKKFVMQDDGGDADGAPPVLKPETDVLLFEEALEIKDEDLMGAIGYIAEDGTYALDENYYVEDGVIYQKETAQLVENSIMGGQHSSQGDEGGGGGIEGQLAATVDQSTNVCCGLCGAIVPYNQLMEVHLPSQHPEVFSLGIVDLEMTPYDTWLRERMQQQEQQLVPVVEEPLGIAGTGGKMKAPSAAGALLPLHRLRGGSMPTYRRITQIRVNSDMSIPALESALRKKMVEKLGRSVPVTLVDKQHAKCGHCNAVISLNKKFEIVHLIRHFNAWHPSAHKCAGSWQQEQHGQPRDYEATGRAVSKRLSTQDFAVVDTNIDATYSLQCVWCGMFMDGKALGMHFHEIHPEEIAVPKCNLCLQELVVNARMKEKFGEPLEITMPDEHHYHCARFNITQKTEAALDRVVEKRLRGEQVQEGSGGGSGGSGDNNGEEMTKGEETAFESENSGCDAFANSQASVGRRAKPKRQFIMPGLRQAVPENSKFVEAVTECHWRCKICKGDIYAAVISAGAIKHYKKNHRAMQTEMQYELCKMRLQRVGGGHMQFVNPNLIECLLCSTNYPLHRPFNMCRAIRHLKLKHPEIMPEYQEASRLERAEGAQREPASAAIVCVCE